MNKLILVDTPTANRHFIVSRGNTVHAGIWLISAQDLPAAMLIFCLRVLNCKLIDNKLYLYDGEELVRYKHALDVIESEEKIYGDWNIFEISEPHWNADIAEVSCGSDIYSVNNYISICRNERNENYKAFVWYLNEGPLVSFYRREEEKLPIIIVERYVIPWNSWPNIVTWSGTAEDLVKSLTTKTYMAYLGT